MMMEAFLLLKKPNGKQKRIGVDKIIGGPISHGYTRLEPPLLSYL